MSWALNQGPSFNVIRPGSSYPKLSGFYQRFDLSQADPRMTPGKAAIRLPKAKKPGKAQKKVNGIPDVKPEPIYGGFANRKPKVVKKKRKRTK